MRDVYLDWIAVGADPTDPATRELIRRGIPPMAGGAQQPAGATIATRPQPQTTVQPQGPGPFVAHAVHSSRPAYSRAAVALGGIVTDPLPQAPGYLRKIRLALLGSGGAGAGAVGTADSIVSVANVVQLLQLKDPMGTPILTGSGFDMLHLAPLFSGQYGILRAADPTLYPTYQTVQGTGGGFFIDAMIPLEGTLAYGLVAVGNASALPTLLLNINTAGGFFATPPATTNPSVTVTAEYDYFAVADPTVEPPGLGTTFQWQSSPANPTIGSAASMRVQLPRTAGYLHTLVLVCRDSTGARVDGYGTRIRLYVDGVPLYDDSFGTAAAASSWALDRMFLESGGNIGIAGTPPTTRPTGVVAYSWRESIAQVNLGLADTQLRLPPITPGTLLEVECTPWGSTGTPPYTLSALFGMCVPRGGLVTGLPQEGV